MLDKLIDYAIHTLLWGGGGCDLHGHLDCNGHHRLHDGPVPVASR